MITKKFLFALLFGCSVAASAQLQVFETGHVAIADTSTQSPAALLTIGPAASTSTSLAVSVTNARSDIFNIGLLSKALKTTLYNDGIPYLLPPYNIGIQGIASGNYSNFGVFGNISDSNDGSGIYGSSSGSAPTIDMSGRFAGYFAGDTRTTGAIYGFLANRYDLYTNNVNNVTNALDILQSLITQRYQAPSSGHLQATETETEAFQKMDFGVHYLLNVSSVYEAAPSLVKTDVNGNSYVNYTELIPLLVGAIRELKAQVDQLTGADGSGEVMMARSKSPNASTSIQSSLMSEARLYQNVPNPFSERTEIRFSLPDNTRNAFIYIFDMTGKLLRRIPVDVAQQSITINGYELSAGIYLYSLVLDGQEIDTKRMILSD